MPFTKCPECGSENLIHISGCVICNDCGWSPCKGIIKLINKKYNKYITKWI